jgi:hypothetical protein
MLKVFKIPGGGCLWFLLKKRLLFYLTVIFNFREMIFNQENHVHAAAGACKKTDAGYVGFLRPAMSLLWIAQFIVMGLIINRSL